MSPTADPPRRSRPDGERSRRKILHEAAMLATVEGLDGLSIGRLAERTGMSKSGLYAHFGSKEELQLATIETAAGILAEVVVGPAETAPPGVPRLLALADRFLDHVEGAVFPGGCFFASAAAELDTRPGPVNERLRESYRGWLALFDEQARLAHEAGELPADDDPRQAAFDVNAALVSANNLFLLFAETEPIERARLAVRRRLGIPAETP